MDYTDKVILAPMVRIGTLPMRLLALDYGADLVYTEELVDQSLASCSRVENSQLKTVDFVEHKDAEPVLRICPGREKGRLILQIGSRDPERALTVAKLVENDVSGIDLNMGCPKFFSIQGGMGAALLSEPDLVAEIVSTLVKGQKNPVTCKIRLLPKLEDTISLCRKIEEAGASAIGIHGRQKEERPQDPNRNCEIAAVKAALRIPVIANGGSKEIRCYADIARFKAETKANSVMIARTAMRNPSIFRVRGLLPIEEVIVSYIKYSIQYENNENNVKYALQRMLGGEQSTTEKGRKLLEASTLRQISRIWGLDGLYAENRAKNADLKIRGERTAKCESNDEDVHLEHFAIPKKRLDPSCAPKSILNDWCKREKRKLPKYETIIRSTDHKFRSILILDDQRFSSSFWERNKKFSENAAAMVALKFFQLEDQLPGEFWSEARA